MLAENSGMNNNGSNVRSFYLCLCVRPSNSRIFLCSEGTKRPPGDVSATNDEPGEWSVTDRKHHFNEMNAKTPSLPSRQELEIALFSMPPQPSAYFLRGSLALVNEGMLVAEEKDDQS